MAVGRGVVVTGASGFLGWHIVQQLAASGWRVVGVGRGAPQNAPLPWLTSYHQVTLPSPQLLAIVRELQPDAFVHCAGSAKVELSVREPLADFESNTVMVHQALEALRIARPECRFVLLSSAAVYGNPPRLPIKEDTAPAPISPYGFHKLQSELACAEYARVYGMQTVSARIFSAYGVGLRRQVVWDICRKALIERRLELLGDPGASRDFIHARDVARAVECLIASAECSGDVFNLASGEEVQISRLAREVVSLLGLDIHPEFQGSPTAGIPRNWRADISKLQAIGFTASVPWDDGLRDVVHWTRADLRGL